MSLHSLHLCLSVIENQHLNLSLIHKEMVGILNLKGRELLGSIADIFNTRPLKDFVHHSLIIDSKREKFMCQDALELCWSLSKAQFLYKVIKSNIQNNQLLNYEKLIEGGDKDNQFKYKENFFDKIHSENHHSLRVNKSQVSISTNDRK